MTVSRGRPRATHPLVAVSIRLDVDLLDHYRSSGKGWMTRMRADIRNIAVKQGM